MPPEFGRRAFLSSGLGGGWLGFSSRSLVGLHPRVETVADDEIDLQGLSVLEPLGEDLLVGGPTSAGFGFCRYTEDGELRWRRTYVAESAEPAENDRKLAVTLHPDGGFVVVESRETVHRMNDEGRRSWKQTPEPDLGFEHSGDAPIANAAVGADGHVYLAGSYARQDGLGAINVKKKLWLSKLDADGRPLWTRSPDVPTAHDEDGVPTVPYMEAADDGLRAVVNAYERSVPRIRSVRFDERGAFEDRSTILEGAPGDVEPEVMLSLRRDGDRYLGTVRIDQETADEEPPIIAVQFDRTLTSSTLPLGSRRLSHVAGLSDGGYFTVTGQSRWDGEYLEARRFGPTTDTFWQERFPRDAGPVAAAAIGEHMAAVTGGSDPRLLVFTERDGQTVTPLLTLAGVGAGLTIAGAAREAMSDE